MKQLRNLFALLAIVATSSVAQANAGTPLMWAGMLHLSFGNLIIGIVEGLLLAKFFGLSKKKCIGLLILANYLSAWWGGVVIARAIVKLLPMGLYTAWPLFWVMVFITYVLTLILEFPFTAFAFRGDSAWLRKSIRASLIVQSISYLVLFGWYWGASGTSLYTQTEAVELSAMSLPENVFMYFISADDGDVYGGSLDEGKWENIYDLNSSDKDDRLFVKPSEVDAKLWDLMARLETGDYNSPTIVPVEQQIASVATPSWRSTHTYPPKYDGTFSNFWYVPKLGEAKSSSWKFNCGFWAIEGLHGSNKKLGKKAYFSLETPFVAWRVRNATHLPTDKVLLQLGDDQICIYDPNAKQIALLAHGRGPIAVMRDESSPDAPAASAQSENAPAEP